MKQSGHIVKLVALYFFVFPRWQKDRALLLHLVYKTDKTFAVRLRINARRDRFCGEGETRVVSGRIGAARPTRKPVTIVDDDDDGEELEKAS